MGSENEAKSLDYGVFLADLEAKRAALDQAIVSIRSLMASGALAVGGGESLPALNGNAAPALYAGAGEIPVGAFLGKSIPDAAKLCLQIVRRKMTTREIAEGLKKGGIETNAKTSFSAMVHSLLTRAASKPGTGIVKFDRSHWGLVDWLPPGLRSAQDKVEVRRPRKAKAKRQRSRPRSEADPALVTRNAESDNGHHPGKLWERAVEFLKTHPDEKFTAKQLSEKFGIHNRVISMTLAKPVKDGKIRMCAPSTYTAAKFSP